MERLETLIARIRKQLFPYSVKSDVDKSCERWDVSDAECLGAWVVQQLRGCCQKNMCSKRGACALYAHGDLAKHNYEICREVILLFENGVIGCSLSDKSDTK